MRRVGIKREGFPGVKEEVKYSVGGIERSGRRAAGLEGDLRRLLASEGFPLDEVVTTAVIDFKGARPT